MFLSKRNSHLHVIIQTKHRLLKGGWEQDTREPDQLLSWIKIASVIKKMYTPSNHTQCSVLQIKNPCCHGNCKKVSHDIARL